jgi:hypothetical protein
MLEASKDNSSLIIESSSIRLSNEGRLDFLLEVSNSWKWKNVKHH